MTDFIMQQIGEIAKNHAYKDKKGKEQPLKINVILNNIEKYMTFMSGNHLNFVDSLQFMSSSLDNLVETSRNVVSAKLVHQTHALVEA